MYYLLHPESAFLKIFFPFRFLSLVEKYLIISKSGIVGSPPAFWG